MSQSTLPPGAEAAERGSGELGYELEALRSHLRLLDELDLQSTELVSRLADAVRSSADVRAQVGLEIEASLERVERLVTERLHHRQMVLRALREEVTDAHTRALGLASSVEQVEQAMAALQIRLAVEPEDETTAAAVVQPELEATASAQPAIGAVPVAPRPAATSVTIDVDQVPSASVALSIQRFVAGLPGVVAATTREFAAGRLRLEVMSRGALRIDEVGLWPGGRLELVEQAADEVAFRVIA